MYYGIQAPGRSDRAIRGIRSAPRGRGVRAVRAGSLPRAPGKDLGARRWVSGSAVRGTLPFTTECKFFEVHTHTYKHTLVLERSTTAAVTPPFQAELSPFQGAWTSPAYVHLLGTEHSGTGKQECPGSPGTGFGETQCEGEDGATVGASRRASEGRSSPKGAGTPLGLCDPTKQSLRPQDWPLGGLCFTLCFRNTE